MPSEDVWINAATGMVEQFDAVMLPQAVDYEPLVLNAVDLLPMKNPTPINVAEPMTCQDAE